MRKCRRSRAKQRRHEFHYSIYRHLPLILHHIHKITHALAPLLRNVTHPKSGIFGFFFYHFGSPPFHCYFAPFAMHTPHTRTTRTITLANNRKNFTANGLHSMHNEKISEIYHIFPI